jgi:hypothetical protein
MFTTKSKYANNNAKLFNGAALAPVSFPKKQEKDETVVWQMTAKKILDEVVGTETLIEKLLQMFEEDKIELED